MGTAFAVREVSRVRAAARQQIPAANGWFEHDDEGDDDIDQGRAQFTALDEIEAAL